MERELEDGDGADQGPRITGEVEKRLSILTNPLLPQQELMQSLEILSEDDAKLNMAVVKQRRKSSTTKLGRGSFFEGRNKISYLRKPTKEYMHYRS